MTQITSKIILIVDLNILPLMKLLDIFRCTYKLEIFFKHQIVAQCNWF